MGFLFSRPFSRQKGLAMILTVTCLAGLQLGASGCSLSLGSGGSKQSDGAQMQSQIKQEMQSEDTRKMMSEMISKTRTQMTADEVLKSPEGQKILEEELKKIMQAPEMQTALQQQMKKTMDSPEMKKTMSDAVRGALMGLLQAKSGQGGGGGAAGGGGGGGGGQS